MSKFDDSVLDDAALNDELDELMDEQSLEASLEHGPVPALITAADTASVMAQYSYCQFCAARLHLVHSTDFIQNTTHERASCPECGLEARRVLHRLQ